ncbi:MAG TPA: IPT/TIG domain-containing protein [Thermoanaerobaculia bacterium]|nr:IPT/TIG domain-containing protein [Thermoanaerobaculia bacterium]
MPKQEKTGSDAEMPDLMALRPPDDLPPGDGGGDGGEPPPPSFPNVTISRISPIAGALTGGITVTLTGTGFQQGSTVYFGSSQAPGVTYESATTVHAQLPAATAAGSVSVSIVNPNGATATLSGGFTYVTPEQGDQAEVLGVTPLAVIEDTDTEITISGRNLSTAYNAGLVALRGPSRAHVTLSPPTNNRDEATGIEALTFTVRITATPPLEPLERMAIQVLASRRAAAQSDGVVESSRQMFTVLPRAIPVPLAYTDNLEPDKPNVVVVAGRNLEGCSLDFGSGATVHLQKSDDRTLVGVVSLTGGSASSASAQFTVRGATGGEVAAYSMSVAPSAEGSASAAAPSSSPSEGAPSDTVPTVASDISLTLTPVPGQQIVAPTAEDSAVFNLRGDSPFGLFFDWSNFEITIVDITIILPIINEVRLIPFFDGGGDVLRSPVLAQVGTLFRLRGMGLLVALRVQITIHVRVVLIIGFRWNIWPFGLFNEFSDLYPWAIGSIVISVQVLIQVSFRISALVALVLPGGKLRVLFSFNLSLGIDFTISTDGRQLTFDPHFTHTVHYTSIAPLHNLLPCDGRFQLAEENGQTVFPDAFGGNQSFYFARAAGVCCVPWNFDLTLVRFAPGQPEETVQESFRADFCVTAAPSTNLGLIIITSEHPEPTGIPPRLVMTFDDRATLKAVAQPVDAAGNPTGPLQNITTLGYNVEFYLDPFGPDVLDPTLVGSGDAAPVLAGDSIIHARIWPKQGEVQLFTFWPGGILGFAISGPLAQGRPPALLGGTLPVTVQNPAMIVVTPTLTFRDPQNPNQPTESPVLFTLPVGGNQELVREIERYEPFEPQQLEYVLAVKLSFPSTFSFPATLRFKVADVQMRVLLDNQMTPQLKPPLENTGFGDGRAADTEPSHFFEKLVQTNQEITINVPARPAANALIELVSPAVAFKIAPYIRDEVSQNKLVPPGELVAGRQVMLLIDLQETSGAPVANIKQLKVAVRNDETFEEYLRVFPETRALLTGDFQAFAKSFYDALPAEGPPAPELLATQGKWLWDRACTAVQTSSDDRPLYWARLQAIGALRAYYKRNRLGTPNITQFEWPSRGLEQADGSISFGTPPPAGRKAIVTGFDPFGLISTPKRSNPSGLAALDFNDKSFGPVGAPVHVRTAVMPVRYDDFDHDLIENAVSPNLGSIVLLMTCSDNSGRNFYDVERWAGKMRGNSLLDNNRKAMTGAPGDVTDPGGKTAGGKQFLESTLPYELVIATDTDTLDGSLGKTPFVVDQSYRTKGGEFRPEPELNDPDKTAWFTKLPEHPPDTAISLEGSGGNYLSNEIFYRTALSRELARPSLPSGHLHVPSTGTQPAMMGPSLIVGVKSALNRFLQAATTARLRSAGAVTFSPTAVNTSRSLTLAATNDTAEAITVSAAEVAQPFAVQLPASLPITVNPGSTLSLMLTITPTAVGVFTRAVRLRNTNGEVVLACTLTGECVQTLPAPVITSFSPTSGRLGTRVTILGQNLNGPTDVRIGGGSVLFTAVDATQITANVTEDAATGPIQVDTPSGTAVSSVSFRVITTRPPREPL